MSESGSPQFYHVAKTTKSLLAYLIQCHFSGTSSQIIFSFFVNFLFWLTASSNQGCKRNVEVRDRDVWLPVRDENETSIPFFPRSRLRHLILKPWQDWDWDIDRPRLRQFSRPWHIELHLNYITVFCLTYFFLQHVSIACYAKRCISYSKSVRPSVCLSVCLSHAGTESKWLKLRSWGLHCRIAPWL